MKDRPFREVAKKYLENLRLENGLNIHMKSRQLALQLIPFFNDKKFGEINRFDVEAFKRHMLDKGFRPATVNRYTNVISNMFYKAVEWGGWKNGLAGFPS